MYFMHVFILKRTVLLTVFLLDDGFIWWAELGLRNSMGYKWKLNKPCCLLHYSIVSIVIKTSFYCWENKCGFIAWSVVVVIVYSSLRPERENCF